MNTETKIITGFSALIGMFVAAAIFEDPEKRNALIIFCIWLALMCFFSALSED